MANPTSESMRIGYFAPLLSIHTVRWLNHSAQMGNEVFVMRGRGFQRWECRSDPEVAAPPALTEPQLDMPATLQALRPVYSLLRPLYRPLVDRTRRMMADSWRKRQLREAVMSLQPDILHAHWLRQEALDCWLTGFCPYMVTVWGSDIRGLASLPFAEKEALVRALRDASLVTAPSGDLVKLCVEHGVMPDRCHVIAVPGVDCRAFAEPTTSGLLKQLGVPSGADVILSCRAMRPNYRIHTVVEAFQIVHRERPNTTLILRDFLPDERYLDTVRKRVDSLGLGAAVHTVGTIPYDQIPELYAISAVVVSIPERDGMPNSLFEAFAAHRPVIGSDLATYDGVLEHDRTGLRVDGSDPRSVASAILRVLADRSLRERLTVEAREVVAQRGDIHREMNKAQDLYRSLGRTSRRT